MNEEVRQNYQNTGRVEALDIRKNTTQGATNADIQTDIIDQ